MQINFNNRLISFPYFWPSEFLGLLRGPQAPDVWWSQTGPKSVSTLGIPYRILEFLGAPKTLQNKTDCQSGRKKAAFLQEIWVTGKTSCFEVWGGIFIVNFKFWKAQKLRRMILLHFGFVALRLHLGDPRKPFIFISKRDHDSQNQWYLTLGLPNNQKKLKKEHWIVFE